MGWALTAVIVVVALALLVSWLGGGRKWVFRTMLSLLILAFLAGSGVFGYAYWTQKSGERRARKLHECAVAKIATARCEQPPTGTTPADLKPYEKKADHGPWEKYPKKTDASKWEVLEVCPPYMLSDNSTPELEAAALAAAEQACQVETNASEKSLHEQVVEYRQKHGIKEPTLTTTKEPATTAKSLSDIFDQVVRDCAAKVRKNNPGAYDDMDDETLVKKLFAKYPSYCDANSGDPPGWKPVIEGIR